jgi:hypothetical protein
MKIECSTCIYNKKNECKNGLIKCLIITTGLIYKFIDGKKIYSKYNYQYNFWKPIEKNHLPEELFEI